LIILALVVGLPLYVAQKVLAITGWVMPVIGATVVIGIVVAVRVTKRREHLAELRRKYPPETVQRILAGNIWQGQTEEELIDTLGQPSEIDRKVLKTMRREIWKYGRISARRFRLRVTVENGMVAGWDHKA
jgi:uncharacterized membrane protein